MSLSDTDRWLTAQQDTLDRLIAEACRDEFARHPEWSGFELSESLDDTWQLSKRGDCCYDRPSIGPTYAIWYHGRRTHDMLRLLRTWPTDAVETGLSVIDLGSGSGATLWALGLLTLARQSTGSNNTPAIDVHAVDASPFMLRFAERMWNEHFVRAYPAVRDLVHVTFHADTWIRVALPCRRRPRICAGHLFDHSDAARVPEIARALRNVAERHDAARVLLTGVKQKRHLLESACDEFPGRAWQVCADPAGRGNLWHGQLACSHRERTSVYSSRIGRADGRWRLAPVWSAGDETVARELSSLRARQEHLFEPPEVPALLLDPEQEAAATPGARATVIIGAAGAGKSIVLAERIARTIRTCGREDRVLVTAFNKRVVDQLAMWVNERLPGNRRLVPKARTGSPSSDEELSGYWCLAVGSDTSPDLIFMNWDLAMTQLMGVKSVKVVVGGELDAHVETAISATREHFQLKDDQHQEILSSSFLLAERHRVVFGLGALTPGAYKAIERRGRGRPLNPAQREVVAHALRRIDCTMIQRRVEALRRIRHELAGDPPHMPPRSISHVFVDEAQDFTHSDFELLHWLNGGRENLVVAGDPTQSLQLGPSYSEPPLPSTRRWVRHRLVGSYRIPLRVCECICPLAEKVIEKHGIGALPESAVAPESRKAAVLGVRPILVVARGVDDAADQVQQIWDTYGGAFALGGVTIAEHDPQLRAALGRRLGDDALVEGQSMNRIKGLERPFIVWSTRVAIDADESVEEWVYTILSRSTSVLAIMITPDSVPELLEIVRLLRSDRLMPWTARAKRWLADGSRKVTDHSSPG